MIDRLNKKILSISLFLFIIAFIYRFYGVDNNHPFWVDEFSTANQARLLLDNGLRVFQNQSINFESHNSLYHFIVAFFFKVMGQSEFAARLPSVIIGSAIPPLVFLLAYWVFNLNTALIAGALTTFSYFEITWSRQARSYVFLQFFILLTLYLYFKIIGTNKKSRLDITLLSFSIVGGLLTHSFFYIFVLALAVHFVAHNRVLVIDLMKKPIAYLVFLGLIIIAYVTGFFSSLMSAFNFSTIIHANNLWYYHSFLWREYGLITYLSLLGLIFIFLSNKKIFSFVIIYSVLHLIFINFIFSAYVSRYLLPLWPFILLMAAYALDNVADILSKKTTLPATTIGVMLVLAIIINGDKFVFKPKQFYSVNHDFREIALIDYHQIYNIVKQKGDLEAGKTAVIDTWPDRLYWYLGRDFKNAYIFRWINEEGRENGLAKKTYFTVNDVGEKVLPKTNHLVLVGEISDLKRVLQKYPKGFIFIDDSSLPKDIRDYAEKHFKKELYLDHYPLDDNPYSLWPATLYSWGL